MEPINDFSSAAFLHFAVHLADRVPRWCGVSRDENVFVLGRAAALSPLQR